MAARRRRDFTAVLLMSTGTVAPAALAGDGVASSPSASCSTRGVETAQVASVESRLELRLTDGRLIRLAGLDPALSTPSEPDKDERAQAAFAARLGQHRITLSILTPMPDRWGRLAAFVYDADAALIRGGLATAAIEAGLGRYSAEPAAAGCRTSLIEAEDRARSARLGLWGDPYYAVLGVDDQAGFAERAGSLVLVQGKVTKVMKGPYRETLVFAEQGAGRGARFSATTTPRVAKDLEARGLRLAALEGRSVRVRGLLDLRFGPQIELTSLDDIEMIDEPAPTADKTAGSP